MPILKMEHKEDPKQEIIANAGDLASVKLFGAQMLVGIYKRPEKTKSGLILTDKYRDEDIWQGKVGLVLKMGTISPDGEDGQYFGEHPIAVGDWVVFRPSDGWPLSVGGGQECRILEDIRRVKMAIESPDSVW